MIFEASGCGGGEAAAEGCNEGDEGCSCFGNDTCSGALQCLSGSCVDANSEHHGGGTANGGRVLIDNFQWSDEVLGAPVTARP